MDQESAKENMNFGNLQVSAEQQYEQNGEWTLPFNLNLLENLGEHDACCNNMEDTLLSTEQRQAGWTLMLVDSGAFGHCCPVTFGKGLQTSRTRRIIGAGGATIPHYGKRNVTFQVWGTDGAFAGTLKFVELRDLYCQLAH